MRLLFNVTIYSIPIARFKYLLDMYIVLFSLELEVDWLKYFVVNIILQFYIHILFYIYTHKFLFLYFFLFIRKMYILFNCWIIVKLFLLFVWFELMQNIMVKVNTYISNPQISCYLIITKFKLIYLNNITYVCFCNILCILENTYEKKYKIVIKEVHCY